MDDRDVTAGLQVGQAADIGRDDYLRMVCLKCRNFIVAHLRRQHGLQQGICPGGTAAQVCVRDFCHAKARLQQDGLDHTA